jgi:hypothetical protein
MHDMAITSEGIYIPSACWEGNLNHVHACESTGTGDASQEGDQNGTDKTADGGKPRAGRGKREGAGAGRGSGRGRGAVGRGDAAGSKALPGPGPGPGPGPRNAATGRGYTFVPPGHGLPQQPDAAYHAYGAPGGYPPPHLRGNFQPHGFAAPGGGMAGFPPAGIVGGAPHSPFMGAPAYHNGPFPPAHGSMMHMQGEHAHGAPPYMQPFGGNVQMQGFGGNAPPQQVQTFGHGGQPYMQGQTFGQQQYGYPHNNNNNNNSGYPPGQGW